MQLAEKRKKVMDKQAVESQELSAKYTEQITALKDEHKAESKRHREQNEEKIELLENTCKKQEQELIRINHQDRVGTSSYTNDYGSSTTDRQLSPRSVDLVQMITVQCDCPIVDIT